MMLIQTPESLDLVLEFDSKFKRENFLRLIESFFTNSNSGKSDISKYREDNYMENNETSSVIISSDDNSLIQNRTGTKRKVKLVAVNTRNELLNEAETKERRQEKLDQFFREAYALSFGVK